MKVTKKLHWLEKSSFFWKFILDGTVYAILSVGMSLEIIRLRNQDTLATVLYQLRQTTQPNVLLVLSANNKGLLSNPVDMAQVKQLSKTNQFNVGIVSIDGRVRETARTLDIPVYALSWRGEQLLGQKPPWWYPTRPNRPGLPTYVSPQDRRVVHRRIGPRPRWWRYVSRYGSTVLFVFTLMTLFLLGYYTVPTATVILKPKIYPINIQQNIVVDPQYDGTTISDSTMPGRLLVTVNKWQASVPSSVFAKTPVTFAEGSVTFANLVPQSITIPAGTRVRTAAGQPIEFQTVRQVTTPAEMGGEVDVEVVALVAGEKGNVKIGRISRIEGALATVLNVRNRQPLSGGTDKFIKTINSKDKERLYDHVVATLFDQAKNEMQNELAPGEFLVDDSIRLIYVYEETYSHFLGEETKNLTLEMKVEYHATAFNEPLALELINEKLQNSVPEGYVLQKETIKPRLGELLGADNEGRVNLELSGSALAVADFKLRPHLNEIRGQTLSVALGYLNEELPLRDIPDIKIWPTQFGRVPYLGARLFVELDLEDEQPK